MFKFVPAGWSRLDVTGSADELHAVAFADPTGARWTLIGHNTSAVSVTLRAALQNLEIPARVRVLVTNATQDLVETPLDAGGQTSLSTDLPADSFFTVTTL